MTQNGNTMTVWEAASALDVPVGQVYALCEVGTLAYVRPGRQFRVLRSAVELLDAPAGETEPLTERIRGQFCTC